MSLRATIPIRSGGKCGRRRSRVTASTPRRSDSRARRSKSATPRTCSTRKGDAYADLAEVLALADRPKAAAEASDHALGRYEPRENLDRGWDSVPGSPRKLVAPV
jgi:hypothetical protein